MELVNYFIERPIFAIFLLVILFMLFKIINQKIAKSKGELNFEVESKSLALNQQINGNLQIKALKDLDVDKVRVRLVIYSETKDVKGNSRKSRLYKDEQEFHNSIQMRVGENREISFILSMPNSNQQFDLVNKIQSYGKSGKTIRCQLKAKVYCNGANLNQVEELRYVHKENLI